jgi:ABC-type multidrug transport system fused ATPase/permease subunit
MSRASSLGSSHPASRQASINAPAIEQRFASSSIEHSDPVDQGFYKGDREYLLTSTQVHGTYRSYMFISVLRWILLLTLAFSLCLPRFNIVNSYYAGRVDICGACLFNARADPGNYYEWSTCGALNVTEFRVLTFLCWLCAFASFLLISRFLICTGCQGCQSASLYSRQHQFQTFLRFESDYSGLHFLLFDVVAAFGLLRRIHVCVAQEIR